MKKILLALAAGILCTTALVGCKNDEPTPNPNPDQTGDNQGDNTGNNPGGDTGDNTGGNTGGSDTFDLSKNVKVYSRDSTSGTRDGFFTTIGLEGAKTDDTLLAQGFATVTTNGDMMNKVAQDEYAIGYASLASVLESDNVKGLNYNGVVPTTENVQNGTYGLSRNFNYIISTKLNENEKTMVNAFIKFMFSDAGLTVVAANDGILMSDLDQAPSWDELKTTDEDVKKAIALSEQGTTVTINLGGSTSVEKIAEALTEAFKEDVSGFKPVHNHTGSGDAYKRTQGSQSDGADKLHIGFLSREIELDSDEPAAEGTYGMICKDGIVAITNPANTAISDATPELLVKIFTGALTTWQAVKDYKPFTGNIQVYSRDTTSGTRDGFFTTIGLEDAKTDDTLLVKGFATVSSNGDMMTKVAQDEYAIGYASLASVLESDDVKGLNYNGVVPTTENVQNGTYGLSRNFNYIVRQDSDMTENEKTMVKAFIKYMFSDAGLTVVAANDGILMPGHDFDSAPSWDELKTSDEDVKAALAITEDVTIKLGGSTSVEKIAEALTQAFHEDVSHFIPSHNHTGSGDAYKCTQGSQKDGNSKLHIGFLSRELELDGDEKAATGTYGMICKDGIVAIVNPANKAINNATPELLVKIFTGEITKWEDVR